MQHISSVDSYECLKVLVKQDLRDLGIKVPKTKKKRLSSSKYPPQSGQEPSRIGGIFGNYLSHVPCIHVPNCGYVPKFLVDGVSFIESHIHLEGLFRKSGSVSRQKDLKAFPLCLFVSELILTETLNEQQNIEEGRGIVDGNVYDVTSLIKQFFRELPEPLFTSAFHDAFIKCFQLGDDEDATKAILMLCLLLPGEHLSTLRYMMLLLDKISGSCDKNKMDAGNLAVVLAPNIMHVNNKTEKMNSSEEKLLQVQTAVVELLIRNAEDIAMVCDSLCERAAMMIEVFGNEDELDASEEILEESRDNNKKKEKKRKRSGSFQGIVSTLTQSFSKWRRNSDVKSSTVNASQMSNNASQVSGKSSDSSLASVKKSIDMTGATPVLMRKRKASGETVPFSASKKKAILQQLPKQATLAHTPFTPATAMKKLDINSMKKNMMDTPSITFSNDSQMSFNATPPHKGKTPRKRLSLFSPSSNRKPKTEMASSMSFTTRRPPSGLSSSRSLSERNLVSSTRFTTRRPPSCPTSSKSLSERTGSTSHLSIQSSGKKKGRNLFRRFSGGKADKVSESDSITQIGNRLATSSNSIADKCPRSKSLRFRKRSKSCSPKHKGAHRRSQSRDKSSIADITQNAMSPSYTEESVLSQNENTGSLNDGFIAPDDEQQNNLNVISTSTDKLNIDHCCPRKAVSDTCMVGRKESESLSKSHRRSFSADDTLDTTAKRQLRRGQPNTIATGLLHSKQHDVAKLRQSFGLDKSEINDPVPLIIPRLSSNAQTQPVFNATKDSHMKTNELTNLEIEKCYMSTEPSANDTLNIILPPPSDFADISMNVQMVSQKACDSDVSETGFSTISGGTVIYNPGVMTLPSGHKTVYRSISAANQQEDKAKSVKSFDSVDSLFSEQSESSPPRRDFYRSNSTDSGKGSLLDSSIAKEEMENNLMTEGEKMPLNAQKSVSSQDPKTNNVSVIAGSQSLLEESVHKSKIQPNLQVSMETHKLSRTGYVEHKSIPLGTADIEVASACMPTIKRTESCIPKYENVLDIKEAQSGKVEANVKHFNDKLKLDPDVTERHSSSLRFPNSVTRKRGCSPIHIPSVFIKNEKEMNHLREVMQSSGIQRLTNGTAKLPISTQWLKPMEKTASLSTHHNGPDPNSSFKTMPSIYAKDERKPAVNESVDDIMMENSVNDSFQSCISTENQLQQIELSKNNVCVNGGTLTSPKQCLFIGNPVNLDSSLLQTINEVCTPLREKYRIHSDKVGRTPSGKTNLDKGYLKENISSHIGKTPVIKQPVLLTPVSEKVILRTAKGNTPRFVMHKPYSPGKRSPMKPVKRLGSPRSPCRSSPFSKSPRKFSHSHKKVVGNTVCGTVLSSVPCYLQKDLDNL